MFFENCGLRFLVQVVFVILLVQFLRQLERRVREMERKKSERDGEIDRQKERSG